MSVGAFCFGLVIGYVTYRTLARSTSASISDIAAVIGAVGGGVVTALFPTDRGDLFGWYAIGLAIGFALWLALFWILTDGKEVATVMGEGDPRPRGMGQGHAMPDRRSDGTG